MKLTKCALVPQDAIKKGAKVAYGPTEPPKIGPKDPFFYPSTVLTDTTSDMLLSHEEVSLSVTVRAVPVTSTDILISAIDICPYRQSQKV